MESENSSEMGKKRNLFTEASGKRVGALRLALGFDTLRGFARDLDVEEDRYTAWEKGKALLPPQILETIRARYGVTADWVYFGDPSGLPARLYDSLKKAS